MNVNYYVQNAEDLLRVVRRLELKALEQECWKHLLSVVNAYNCRELHELADRFDCPPLKLTSWHMLQEMRVGYSTNPSTRLGHSGNGVDGRGLQPPALPFGLKGSGLTGPGESDEHFGGDGDAGNGSDQDEYLSVFNDYTDEFRAGRGEESTTYSEEQEQLFPLPEQLPPGAPASDVIKAWAYKLQLVYDMCAPRDGLDQFGNGHNKEGDRDYDEPSEAGDYYDGQQYQGRRYGAGDNRPESQQQSQRGGSPNRRPDEPNGGGWSRETDPNYATMKQNLIDYYTERGLNDKISSVDNILSNFSGREDMIYEALRNKYDNSNSADYIHPKKHARVIGKQSSKGFLGGLFS